MKHAFFGRMIISGISNHRPSCCDLVDIVVHDDPTSIESDVHGFLLHIKLAVEVLTNLPHARPPRRPHLAAHEAQLQHPLLLLFVVTLSKPLIHGAQQLPLDPELADPAQQAAHCGVDGLAPAGHLEEQHAEGEHVGGRGGPARLADLRRHVSQCPDNARHGGVRTVVVEAGQAEVAEPHVRVVGADEHVAGLHVAVHHRLLHRTSVSPAPCSSLSVNPLVALYRLLAYAGSSSC
jgi:hypothetical protein